MRSKRENEKNKTTILFPLCSVIDFFKLIQSAYIILHYHQKLSQFIHFFGGYITHFIPYVN